MMESPTQSPVGLEPVTPRHPIGATTSRSKSGCIQCRTRKVRRASLCRIQSSFGLSHETKYVLWQVKCDERPGGCATCQRLSFRCSFQPADAVSGRSPAGSHNSDDGYATAIARKRVRRACLQCRSQKLRCSGDSPKCERCMSKHLSCTYQSLPASRRNKGSTNRRYRFEGREQTRNSQPAEPANQNRTPMAMGSTSAISPMDTATTAPSLPQFVDTSKAVIQQHLDAFFQYVYPTATFNFIHRGSFLHSWHKDVLSRSLLRATVGVARRFMDLDREPAIRWLEESERDVVADLDLISIPKLQILLLLIFDRLASAKFSSTWYLMSLASRVAHGLKLGQPTSAVPFTNQECRRRLMWCVYSVERMGSTDGLCTTYPPLCPRPFMQVQLPCDERSFELEFECTTHYLDDLANNKYDNASKLGVSAYLIRVLDLREQIQTFCHRSDKPGQRSPWDGDSEFWRLEQELSDLSSSLPPEMQDSDRAVCIRSNTPESNVYIMVQTWLHTCWADLAGSFVYGRSVSEEDAAATTPSHNRTEFLESCRLILLEHAMALHRFWSRIQSTQPASRKLFTTDWNIAPCVYGNSRDILSTYASHPNLRVNSSQAIHAALRLNIDILSAQKSLTEYSARWVSITPGAHLR